MACQEQLLRDKDTSLDSLEENNTNLTLELEEVKLDRDSGWTAEKRKIKNEDFENGLRSYCRTFLAGEPKYDWAPKFGKGMANWMADLSGWKPSPLPLRRQSWRRHWLRKGKSRRAKKLLFPNIEGVVKLQYVFSMFSFN